MAPSAVPVAAAVEELVQERDIEFVQMAAGEGESVIGYLFHVAMALGWDCSRSPKSTLASVPALVLGQIAAAVAVLATEGEETSMLAEVSWTHNYRYVHRQDFVCNRNRAVVVVPEDKMALAPAHESVQHSGSRSPWARREMLLEPCSNSVYPLDEMSRVALRTKSTKMTMEERTRR